MRQVLKNEEIDKLLASADGDVAVLTRPQFSMRLLVRDGKTKQTETYGEGDDSYLYVEEQRPYRWISNTWHAGVATSSESHEVVRTGSTHEARASRR